MIGPNTELNETILKQIGFITQRGRYSNVDGVKVIYHGGSLYKVYQNEWKELYYVKTVGRLQEVFKYFTGHDLKIYNSEKT